MQPRAALRIGTPRIPRRQEIEPQPESGLEDGESVAPPPPIRQVVAAEEDIARLREATGLRVVDVAELARIRRPVFGTFEDRGGEGNEINGVRL